MLEHKRIEDLLSFYIIKSCQDIEDKDEDLFEGENNSSDEENDLNDEENDSNNEENDSNDEENEMVMLGLTSLLGT